MGEKGKERRGRSRWKVMEEKKNVPT